MEVTKKKNILFAKKAMNLVKTDYIFTSYFSTKAWSRSGLLITLVIMKQYGLQIALDCKMKP